MTHMAVPKIIRNFELQTEDSNVLVYTTRRSPGFISTDAGTCVHGLQYSLASAGWHCCICGPFLGL